MVFDQIPGGVFSFFENFNFWARGTRWGPKIFFGSLDKRKIVGFGLNLVHLLSDQILGSVSIIF